MLVVLSLFWSLMAPVMSAPTQQMQEVLKSLKDKRTKPLEKLEVHQAREQVTPQDAMRSVMEKRDLLSLTVIEEMRTIEVDGAAGKIPARLYLPKGEGPFPVVVYFHGGGWVIADSKSYDATPRALAEKTGAIFISPDYRKGPEFKFPAAHDDAFMAYQWVVRNATSFNGDPKRIAVAGESAGGNLALNVAIMARDRGVRMPEHQILIYPVAGGDFSSTSYQEHRNSRPLSKETMAWFYHHYLRTPADRENPKINLLKADLSALPPTTIITAEIDPLRSEGEELARRLRKKGVSVYYKNYSGVTHEFFGMAPLLKEAVEAQEEVSLNLKRSFQ